MEVKGGAPKASSGHWDLGVGKGGAPKASSPLSRLLLWLEGVLRGVRNWEEEEWEEVSGRAAAGAAIGACPRTLSRGDGCHGDHRGTLSLWELVIARNKQLRKHNNLYSLTLYSELEGF